MNIVENKSWQLGPYTVRQQPRFDNPAWAKYLVFRGDRLIGSLFSNPDVGACQSLEREAREAKADEREAKQLAGASDGRRGRYGRAGRVERDIRAYLTTTNDID